MAFFGISFALIISALRRREVNMGILDEMAKGLFVRRIQLLTH
jgi:hypothetical protein